MPPFVYFAACGEGLDTLWVRPESIDALCGLLKDSCAKTDGDIPWNAQCKLLVNGHWVYVEQSLHDVLNTLEKLGFLDVQRACHA